MKNTFHFKSLLSMLLFVFLFSAAEAQDKNVAKVDDYIAKAKQTTDVAKKNELYNKAAALIMSARLDKSEYVKIADSYLEEGDINNAVKFYMRTDKADKNEGYVKTGHKMIELAFDDPKNEAKTMKKAIDYFSKGGAAAEGYEAAGDAYYTKGKEHYMKAADYYAQGKITAKVDKIANEYIAEKKLTKAAEVYMKLDTEEGYKKAGDLYFNAGEYNDAFTAYDKGMIAEGIKKYADKLYDNGEISDGDALYARVGEMYIEKKDYDALAALGDDAEKRNNFNLAAGFYQKSGKQQKASRALAFEQLFDLDYTNAKASFEAMGDADMGKAISSNLKYLMPLKDVASFFEDVKRNQPYVGTSEDPTSKKQVVNKEDEDAFISYYKDLSGILVDYCYTISNNVTKITHSGLKEAMMRKFRQYGAVRNVLDANFGKKLQKSEANARDVVL